MARDPRIRAAWHPTPRTDILMTDYGSVRVHVGDERRVMINTGELIDI